MARTAYFTGYSYGSVDTGTKKQQMSFTCEWANNAATDDHVRIGFLAGTSNPPGGSIYWYDNASGLSPGYWRDWPNVGPETITYDGGTTGSLRRGDPLDCDKTYYVNARVTYWLDYAETTANSRTSSTSSFKTYPALSFSAAAPTVGSITASSAVLSGAYTPNTNESTATVLIQYKKTTDSSWTTAQTYNSQTGYAAINYSGISITGLTQSTSYQVRVSATRTTYNDTTFTSSTGSFTTLASAPTIATNEATSVGPAAATLNATVDSNGVSTDVTFEWDTSSGEPYANETTPAENFSVDGDAVATKDLSGLSAVTPYYFRAKAVHAGGTVYGSEKTFTTDSGDPETQARLEDHLLTFQYDRKYGVATSVYFSVASPSATSSNVLVTTAPGTLFATNDIKISKDGGAAIDVDSLTTPAITQVTNATQIYILPLTAAEMQATDVFIRISDAAGGPAFRDALIHIRTKQQLGQIDIDATQIGGNTPGFTTTGIGTGAGLIAVGGATAAGDIVGFNNTDKLRKGTAQATTTVSTEIKLDSAASATTDFYAGQIVTIVSGTAAGQSRVITAYNGTTKVATVHKAFSANPTTDSVFIITPGPDVWEIPNTAELSGIPAVTATWRQLLTFLFQRFAYKRTQTATVHTMYKADSSTPLGTTTVSDAAGTQSFNKLS
jgi:hypothetical protein